MDADRKKEHAVHFIASLRDMRPEDLQTLIRSEAGESLSAFFAAYAAKVMEDAAAAPEATASTLMMLGYLIRAREPEEARAPGNGAGKGELLS